MRIGDQVRFLNEIGGGKVAGFKGKNIVLVEDEDGFQIPMNINEVVVAETEDYSMGNALKKSVDRAAEKRDDEFINPGNRSVSALLRDGQDEEIDLSVEDMVDDSKEVTFKLQPQEREGGNLLSAYLAFVPAKGHTSSAPCLDLYFVNDSNYTMQYVCATPDEEEWKRYAGDTVEPNTKNFVASLGREDINALSKLHVQLLAFKEERSYELKPLVEVTLRIEPVKFFKTNTYRVNPFFETPAVLYTVIENDRIDQPRTIDAMLLKEAMYKSADPTQPRREEATGQEREQLVRRYTSDQRKGGRKNPPYVRERALDDAVVVDLHADELLDTTAGMKSGEILEYQLKVFKDTLTSYAQKKGQKLIFIHGKGEGVLRRALVNAVKHEYKGYTCQDASFQEYGYGATMIIIK